MMVKIGNKRAKWPRYLLMVIFALIGLYSLQSIHYYTEGSGSTVLSSETLSSLHDIASYWNAYFTHGEEFVQGEESDVSKVQPGPLLRRANATLVMLARNGEIEGVADSMRQLEDRFNHKFHYPWVFLNDEPFTAEFIRRTSLLTRSNVSYGLIPQEQWVQPEWIDEEKARRGRHQMTLEGIIYGHSVPYRNMCRFNSGFFYKHPLLEHYKYYWRVEPDVRFYCDMDYDPFLKMEDEGKVYGFTMALREYERTIPTLWKTVREFIARNPESIHPDNALGFLSDNWGASYNLCHFWSNFEIADMDFWRSETYSRFFEHLDHAGGFYYERWGDAPVHSIAAALFLPKDKLHFFSDIGYKHSVFQHCPQGDEHTRGRCWCNPQDNFDYTDYSCIATFEKLFPEVEKLVKDEDNLKEEDEFKLDGM